MKKLGVFAIAVVLMAAPAFAAEKLVVETSKKCSFTITLRADLAPKHVAQISKLAAAGFVDVEVEPTRVYRVEDAREFLAGAGLDLDALAPVVDGKFMSAFVRARKPKESPS